MLKSMFAVLTLGVIVICSLPDTGLATTTTEACGAVDRMLLFDVIGESTMWTIAFYIMIKNTEV